jgi:hypothetical protein
MPWGPSISAGVNMLQKKHLDHRYDKGHECNLEMLAVALSECLNHKKMEYDKANIIARAISDYVAQKKKIDNIVSTINSGLSNEEKCADLRSKVLAYCEKYPQGRLYEILAIAHHELKYGIREKELVVLNSVSQYPR